MGLHLVAATALVFSAAAGTAGESPCTSERISGPSSLRALTRHIAARDPIHVLAIGSSSTEGVGATSAARSYPAQLQAQLRTAWSSRKVDVRNAGIGGETADQTLARLETILAGPDKPALVLWQVGTNDALAGGDEAPLRARLERGIAAVRAAGADLILVDQQFFPKVRDAGRYERFVRLVGAVAADANVPLFSRFRLMKSWAEKDPKALAILLSSDGFHMGDAGYECLASGLSRNVTEMVSRAVTGARADQPRAVLAGTAPLAQ